MSKLISSKGSKSTASPPYGRTVCAVLFGIIVISLLLLNLFTHVLSVINYYGDGMEPELHSGQTLIIAKTQKVDEGDIVAFYYNNKVLVRRVICSGGKYIDITNDGSVSINGDIISEPYVDDPSLGQCNIQFPYTVPYGSFFVMGDSREIAMDSRLSDVGCISADRIIGKVILSI